MESLTPCIIGNIYSPVSQQIITNNDYVSWLEYVGDKAIKTQQTYERAIRQFAKWVRDNNIYQPTRTDIISYRNMLANNYKPTTAQAYMAAVKLFYKWLNEEKGWKNVTKNIKGFSIDKEHKKDYLTTDQVKLILNGIDRATEAGKRDYAIAVLMLTTGLRTTSIINANVGDMGTAGNSSALYYLGKGHQEKAAYVKLAQPVYTAIQDYLATRGKPEADAPLFASLANKNKGERLTTKSISRLCKNMLVNAGLDSDRLTAHSFRHTAATQNLLNGGTLEETQQLLGHKNIETTMIYVHTIERENNNSELRIAAALLG